MRFPYSCICRKNFFDKTETTDTTDTTIWKPGYKNNNNNNNNNKLYLERVTLVRNVRTS